MKEDFSELIEYLDKKFNNIDSRFSDIDSRFLDIDSRFSDIDSRFSDIDSKLEDLCENKADKSDINELINAVDAYAKKADIYFQEMLMLAHKIDHH